MALSIDGYNKLFKSFTDFAQERVNANDGKSIADANIETKLSGRKMLAVKHTTADSVHNWTRGLDLWIVNDRTRKLFRQTVAGMFGGESKIPESVKKAMLLSDYGQGKPLTARRIMAVKQAIDNWKSGMLPVKINKATAHAMIADAAKLLGSAKALDEDTATSAAECLRRYGNGLPAKTACILANFIVNIAVTDGLDEEKVANLATDMRGWREFDFGDPRLAKLGAKFVQRQNDYLKDSLPKADQYSSKQPDVFQQLYSDADRGHWNICGSKFPINTKPDIIVDKFLSVVKGSNARKVISTLFNQGNLADMESLFCKTPALIGDAHAAKLQEENLYTIEGGEMFVSRDTKRDGLPITNDITVRYGLDISEDGKTATLTLSIDKNINSLGLKYNEYNLGMATITQKTTVDLTKEMPEVTDVTFSQTFTGDRININPNNWMIPPANNPLIQ